jgi:DNA-binding CsgD family transcriptional regulator
VEPLEEIVRLLAIQLRRDAESQAEAIEEMSRAGFGPTRIAELLGTTPNTVNVAISSAKKRKRQKER